MNIDIGRSFSKLVFLQIMLGTVAFCMASQDMGMLLIVVTLGSIAWLVVERRGGKPMPQWIIGSGAVVASGWMILAIFERRESPVLAMGHFILWLQLLLLFGRKTNREYAELLILSLMLMIGATAVDQKVIYGLLMIIYYGLALFTMLAFQMKITADRVTSVRHGQMDQRSGAVRAGLERVAVGRGHRWQYRTTAGLLGMTAGAVGLMVFIFLPRTGGGAGTNAEMAELQNREVDFASQIDLDDGPPQTASREPVMNVRVTLDGQSHGSTATPMLVRGAALDYYDVSRRRWSSNPRAGQMYQRYSIPRGGRSFVSLQPQAKVLEATFTLRARSPRTLFTLYPPTAFESDDLSAILYNTLDQTLLAVRQPRGTVEYTVSSPLIMPPTYHMQVDSPTILDAARPHATNVLSSAYAPLGEGLGAISAYLLGRDDDDGGPDTESTPEQLRLALQDVLTIADQPVSATEFWWSRVSTLPWVGRMLTSPSREERRMLSVLGHVPRSPNNPAGRPTYTFGRFSPAVGMELTDKDYAAGWEVDQDAVRRLSVAVLGASRVNMATATDATVARVLSNYVRENHSYSLFDVPETNGRDPTIAFLFDHRQGHCELFASGLAAMARSVGLRARVVTGYLANEYNQAGGYYIVRKADAHAWTEIYCEGVGWRVFDPTPSADVVAATRGEPTMFSRLMDFYDHIEFAWIGSIVTYDSSTRSGILENMQQSLNAVISPDGSWISRQLAEFEAMLGGEQIDTTNMILLLVMVISATIIVGFVVYRLIRLARLRLPALRGRMRRRGLPRHLQFYTRAMRLLERYGYKRPNWQTPLAFAESLSHVSPEQFSPLMRLTHHFYDLLYGDRELDEKRKAEIENDLYKLESALLRNQGETPPSHAEGASD